MKKLSSQHKKAVEPKKESLATKKFVVSTGSLSPLKRTKSKTDTHANEKIGAFVAVDCKTKSEKYRLNLDFFENFNTFISTKNKSEYFKSLGMEKLSALFNMILEQK